MARSKTKLVSRFPQAIDGAHEAFDEAIKEALIVGQETAQARLEKSGYDVDPLAVHKKHFRKGEHLEGGMIFVHSDKWYYRFFETGTVYISATPFMRPATTKMRKSLRASLASNQVEQEIAKKTRLGRSRAR